MKILITGASGFVAAHFINFLSSVDDRFSVFGIYHLNKPHFNSGSNVDIQLGEINMMDKKAVRECLLSFKPDFILHLASKSSVAFSWQHPSDSIIENTMMFLNIIEVMREDKLGCRLLSVGSSEEYGSVSHEELPLTEASWLNAVSPYAASRVMQSNLARIYAEHYKLDIIHTRSFNHLGPNQSSRFVIASFIRQIVEQRKHGNKIHLNVGDVTVTKDFTDVRDVVKAYYGLFKNGVSGETYNVCSGKGYELKTIIDMLAQITKTTISWTADDSFLRPDDTKAVVGSYEKINRAIGWKPEIMLQQTLEDMITAYQLQPC